MTARDRDSPRSSTGKPRHSLLRHRHRRWALKCLARTDGSLHLADLAHDVARIAAARRGKSAVLDEAETLYVRLYHNHVPRLHEAGVVSFDRETRLVSTTAETDDVLASLEHTTDPQLLERRA